jgi:hypothetical protein
MYCLQSCISETRVLPFSELLILTDKAPNGMVTAKGGNEGTRQLLFVVLSVGST